jgi:CO/xanthine dehydrogenase FAD-binding subunit
LIERVADLAAGPAKPLDNTDFSHPYRKRVARVYVARALAAVAGFEDPPASEEVA